ncbi:MAG: hypothetical protein QXM75_01270 [Candidatus Diapherotrites archaeon]
MMGFFAFLREAFLLMLKKPALFLPKILVTIFYSIVMLYFAKLLIENASLFDIVIKGEVVSTEDINAMRDLIAPMLLLIFFMLIAYVIDILVNAMYPTLIEDFYRNGKISLKKAFFVSIKNFYRIVPLGFGLLVLVSLPITAAQIMFAQLNQNFAQIALFGLLLAIIGALCIVLIFYFVYPAVILHRKPISKCLKYNFELVRKNKRSVAGASIISLISTVLSLGLSFIAVFEPIFVVLFFVERFLVTILFTYNSILNQVIYFGVTK